MREALPTSRERSRPGLPDVAGTLVRSRCTTAVIFVATLGLACTHVARERVVCERVARDASTGSRRAADAISGRVVDLGGTPIAGVRVQAWPRGSGFPASATSDARGAFAIVPVQARPHVLEVVERPPFGAWCSGTLAQPELAPGTRDVEIRLRRRVPTTFVVVDDVTGAPVTQFGFAIEARPGSSSSDVLEFWPRAAPPFEDHAVGELVLDADPLGDDVTVVAPGFAPFEGAVTLDAGPERRQTIRLERGVALRGTLVIDDMAPPRTHVLLSRDFVASVSRLDSSRHAEVRRYDLSALASHSREILSNRDGTFVFDHLAAGTYQVQIHGTDVVPVSVRSVRVGDAVATDLGTIGLVRGATIEGRVVVDGRPWNCDLSVRLGHGWTWPATVAADGTFRIDGLPAGEHALALSGSLVEHRDAVTLHAGETLELEIDLTGVAPCDVRVSVRRNGEPLRGVRVSCEPATIAILALDATRGTTARDGTTRFLVSADAAELVARSHAGVELARSARPSRLERGGEHLEILDVVAGSLIVEMPEALAPPRDGRLEIELEPRGHPERRVDVIALAKDAATFGASALPWTAGPVEVGLVPPGDYVLRARARSDNGRTLLFECAPISITVRANETTRARLDAR